MRIVLLSFLIVFYFYGSTELLASAELQGAACEFILTDPKFVPILPDKSLIPKSPTSERTVQVGLPTGILRDRGIDLVISKIPGKPWYTDFAIQNGANITDPRAPFYLMGSDVAAVLGYHMPDADSVYVPSVQRLNRGIALLNSRLSDGEKIGIEFYEQTSKSSAEYLERVAENKVAVGLTDVYLAAHDHAVHVSRVLDPTADATRISLGAKYIALPFIAYVKRTSPQFSELATEAGNSYFDGAQAQIFAFLGSVGDGRRQPITYHDLNMQFYPMILISGIFTAEQILRSIFVPMRGEKTLRVLTEEYIQTHKAELRHADREIRNAGLPLRHSTEHISEMLKRRRLLREAARKVLADSALAKQLK